MKHKPSMTLFCLSWSAAECWVVRLAITGVSGAGNIVVLLAVMNVIITPLGLLAATVEKKPDARPNWSKHLVSISDLGQTFALCWSGWWWCSLSFAVGALISAGIRYRKTDKELNDAPTTPTA